MSLQVVWTKDTIANFIEYGNLDEEEAYLIENRRKKSRVQLSFEMNRSVSWIDKKVKVLKIKYDTTQMEHPDKLKPRAKDATELYS